MNKTAAFILGLFLILLAWWVYIHYFISTGSSSEALQLWAASYQLIALTGAIIGLIMSHRWGGFKSALGRSVIAFSLGLLFQSLGQTAYSYYIYYLGIDVPYPSLGDIGFFGSILFYIYGATMLAKVSGAHVSLKSFFSNVQVFFIPLVILLLSYIFFLREYTLDGSQPLKTLLDFGYPLGQAIYVSIAILAFFLSRKMLGGMLKTPIIIFIFALILQYLSDFTFLYQASMETWYAGGVNDLMYCISYLLMALALINIGRVFDKIKSS
jgi:hypothetical protein